MPHLDRVFQMGDGYVLNFSDRTFASFFAEELGIDIHDQQYAHYGTSKAKRLRCFLQTANPGTAARTLHRLWEHREELRKAARREETEPAAVKKLLEVIKRLKAGIPSTKGIERFSADATLEELVASIERDIHANKPQVALDRLHTYCMKKFAHLLALRGEVPQASETLNGRAGRYFNPLRRTGRVRPISEKIMKTTVETFELFNNIRNNESLAHDNILVEANEARFIFEGVVNLLRFVQSIEGKGFEQ
jgi:hypothetical protein